MDSTEDQRAEYADELVSNFQQEEASNRKAPSLTGRREYKNEHRDIIRDAVLFALDNGWTP